MHDVGLDVGEASKLTPKTPADEAWSVVCRSCRVEAIALADEVGATGAMRGIQATGGV